MNRAKLEKRLSGYWKMEAANVLIIPATIAFLAILGGWRLGLVTAVTMFAMCLLLVIGAQYWRAKLAQLRAGGRFPRGIALIARLQLPALLFAAAAVAMAVAGWVMPGLALSPAERWVGTVCALLAALEYVNYYHRQLQHFDHAPDWQRLISGKGFRPSQMAVDIRRWRASQ